MNKVFVDTGYWIAISNPKDNLHAQAVAWNRKFSLNALITSEMVLSEFLDGSSRQSQALRRAATALVTHLCENSSFEIVPQTPALFSAALKLYRNRLDKGWSHTDCASFCIMKEQGITEALAYDKHFEQAGFIALLRLHKSDLGHYS